MGFPQTYMLLNFVFIFDVDTLLQTSITRAYVFYLRGSSWVPDTPTLISNIAGLLLSVITILKFNFYVIVKKKSCGLPQ